MQEDKFRFKLETSGHWYNNTEKEKLEKLGFRFTQETSGWAKGRWYRESGQNVGIEFSTIQELMDFISEWGEVVLDNDSIEIYDDYRE